MLLNVTDTARDYLFNAMQSAGLGEGYAARLKILGRTLSGFKYDFRTVLFEERMQDDTVVDLGQFEMYLDPFTAENLRGTIIDVKPQGGLRIDNPNPVIPSSLAREVATVLETKINPGVSVHNGQVLLVDVKDQTVFVNMEGGCKGCGMARATFKLGIEKMIKEAIPQIEEIIDVTEHDKGQNPYYLPSATGESPLQ